MEEQSYASTHPLGHTGSVTGNLYLLYEYIYTHIHTVYTYIYIYIERERERERGGPLSTAGFIKKVKQ